MTRFDRLVIFDRDEDNCPIFIDRTGFGLSGLASDLIKNLSSIFICSLNKIYKKIQFKTENE